jgi:hypothetical protein
MRFLIIEGAETMNPSIIALVLLSFFASEPQSSRNTILGTVTSHTTGERITNAEITLYPPPYLTHSDSNGVYRLAKILDGEYSLRFSAPGYASLTFRGLIFPLFTPLVIDAKLHASGTSSDSIVVMKFTISTLGRSEVTDKMRFYQPDSTIDYKIRIVNPETRPKGPRSFTIPDTLLKRR